MSEARETEKAKMEKVKAKHRYVRSLLWIIPLAAIVSGVVTYNDRQIADTDKLSKFFQVTLYTSWVSFLMFCILRFLFNLVVWKRMMRGKEKEDR